MVFSPVPFQWDQASGPQSPEINGEQPVTEERKGILDRFQAIVSDSLKCLFHPSHVSFNVSSAALYLLSYNFFG